MGISLPSIICQIVRNQEKGVLAKGVSAESSLTPKKTTATVVSQIITPEKNIFYKLIRRGVVYYAGKFLPQIISFELIGLG